MDIIEYGNKTANTVLLQPVDEHDLALIENEIALIRENVEEDFMLAAFRVGSWNNDLSPWEAPAVFGNEGFDGNASRTLAEILDYCGDKTKNYYIGGYSLAGLFALWSACQTDLFVGVAAASPSVWFPGFGDYLKEGKMKTGCVYLSLGDKEERTRNPVTGTVGDRIREAEALLTEQGVNCILEWNSGNHFKDPELRTAKAFTWVMKQKSH